MIAPLQSAPGIVARRVVDFARALRAAGLPIGVDRTTAAVRAVDAVGLARRDDLRAALRCTLVAAREHEPAFDAAFDAFWRAPAPDGAAAAALPGPPGPPDAPEARDASGRSAPPAGPDAPDMPRAADRSARSRPPATTEGDPRRVAWASWSDIERLRSHDFGAMTPQAFAAACRLVRELPPPVDAVAVRRWRAAGAGRIDLRGTLRAMAREPGLARPRRRARRMRPAPLVILCDVSGSMDRYARVVLHWAHALVRARRRVAVFVFATRLTDVTRALRAHDPDGALAAVGRAVPDWGGGTRIGPALDRFNRDWARRVLTGNASVLLVTDGLDRAADGSLGDAAAMLGRFARRVIWLNPLLRYDGFEPRAAGVRALLPHVDLHLPVHSLERIQDLGRALRGA